MKKAVFELLDGWEREIALCRDERVGHDPSKSKTRKKLAKGKGGAGALKRIAKSARTGKPLTRESDRALKRALGRNGVAYPGKPKKSK